MKPYRNLFLKTGTPKIMIRLGYKSLYVYTPPLVCTYTFLPFLVVAVESHTITAVTV